MHTEWSESFLAAPTLLVLALAVGASAAVLFAPNSGHKAREDLTYRLEQSVSTAHEVVDPTLMRLEKVLVELRKNVEDKVDERRKA